MNDHSHLLDICLSIISEPGVINIRIYKYINTIITRFLKGGVLFLFSPGSTRLYYGKRRSSGTRFSVI